MKKSEIIKKDVKKEVVIIKHSDGVWPLVRRMISRSRKSVISSIERGYSGAALAAAPLIHNIYIKRIAGWQKCCPRYFCV